MVYHNTYLLIKLLNKNFTRLVNDFLLISILAQCKRLEGGLDKLKEAAVQLAELNLKLAEQKVVLADKSAACEALLDEISVNTAVGE